MSGKRPSAITSQTPGQTSPQASKQLELVTIFVQTAILQEAAIPNSKEILY
jgi:hypothetical protein